MSGTHEPARIIAVCGGSGSGKTTAAQLLRERLGTGQCAILSQDWYYIDQSDRFDGDGGSVNFDHPDSLDFDLLGRHLGQLMRGVAAEVPQYDFVTHARQATRVTFAAVPTVIVDGTLLLSQPKLRPLFDYAIFMCASESARLLRRIERDTRERGREPDGVRRQFERHVKPMHDLFVEPSKRFADQIIWNERIDTADLARVLSVA